MTRRLLPALALFVSCAQPLPAESPLHPDTTHLLSFRDYLDVALFQPSVGYYASGRVDLHADFRTFPVALAPSFGQMVAEQVFRMWEGMRRAGTLSPGATFTVAEVGAGDGTLAESILDYVAERARVDTRWHHFEEQLLYLSFDRSPALRERQEKRNARFGARFEARAADATDLGAAIPKGSLTGVILSNELLDCFSVHKVIWDDDGTAKVAFVSPSLERVPFDKASFPAWLESVHERSDYEQLVSRLRIDEVYAPVSAVPDVAEHLRRYAREYAHHARGAYVNLGAAKFIRDAGEALRAGYVLTIDYGSGWAGSLADGEHLRIYGRDVPANDANPYEAPTLRDITTDVNFGHLAAEGRLVGLEPLYFGAQRTIRMGTPIVLDAGADDYATWAKLFESWDVYKVLLQQKRGTDPAYAYPGAPAEPL